MCVAYDIIIFGRFAQYDVSQTAANQEIHVIIVYCKIGMVW